MGKIPKTNYYVTLWIIISEYFALESAYRSVTHNHNNYMYIFTYFTHSQDLKEFLKVFWQHHWSPHVIFWKCDLLQVFANEMKKSSLLIKE